MNLKVVCRVLEDCGVSRSLAYMVTFVFVTRNSETDGEVKEDLEPFVKGNALVSAERRCAGLATTVLLRARDQSCGF